MARERTASTGKPDTIFWPSAGPARGTEAQEELAFASGRHFTYVSLLERGRNSPLITTVWRLADALGVTAPELIPQVDERVRRSGS